MLVQLNRNFTKGDFTHKSRAVTMKSWEPKRKCPKVVPRHIQNHVVWSWTLKCRWSHMWPGLQPNAISMNFIHAGLTHDKIKQINGCERSECLGHRVLCQAYLQEVIFENNPSDHETWSIWCHVGLHINFTSILHSLTMLVPQAYCEANLDQLCLFHQWECLKCNGHGLSVLRVKWP